MYPLKKFDDWSITKKIIENREGRNLFLKEREVWYVNMGVNIGWEEDGKGKFFKRPVIVIRKLGNMILCVSMTTKGKDDNLFYKKLNSLKERKDGKSSYLIKSQPKSLDKSRFIQKIGVIAKDEFEEIKKELQEFWF